MKKNQAPNYYPISLNLSGKRCVVVGGGQVALRKVRTLLECGAQVDIISPSFCPELEELAESQQIHVLSKHYQSGDLKHAFLVIAATDSHDVNQQVAKEAQNQAMLVNVVDNAENSDFITPSYLRRGTITIAISTGGKSPALARKIRTKIEKDFSHEYASLALLIDEVRRELTEQGLKVEGDTWQEALDIDVLLKLVKQGDNEKAKFILRNKLKRQ